MKSKPISKTIKSVVSKQIKKSAPTKVEKLTEDDTSESSIQVAHPKTPTPKKESNVTDRPSKGVFRDQIMKILDR